MSVQQFDQLLWIENLHQEVYEKGKTLVRTTVRGHINPCKTWPHWKTGKLLLSKIVQGNASQKKETLNRWTKYYSELYNHKTNDDPSVLNCPQTDTEDDHPILRKTKVEAAIKSLKKGKSAGDDSIPAEQGEGNRERKKMKSKCSHILLLLMLFNIKSFRPRRDYANSYSVSWCFESCQTALIVGQLVGVLSPVKLRW